MSTATIPAYEALALDIKNLGIEVVFSLMSDDTALFLASLDAAGVRVYGARHENNACAMAEGYAAATGRVGVVVLGRGPGTANAMHGMTYAQRTRSPVLMIVGDMSNEPGAPNGLGPDAKEFDTPLAVQSARIRSYTASDAQTARRTLAQAVAATREGAVALLLPSNVQFGMINLDATVPGTIPPRPAASTPARTGAIEAAAALLAKSRKPLVVAGYGAHAANARDAIIAFADHIGAALATTVKAKDLFRGHPFDCGILGSFSNAGGRRLIEQADCVVAFGAGLNLRTTSFGLSIPAGIPIVQVDRVRGNIGRWFHSDVGIVADAGEAAGQLRGALPARPASDQPLRDNRLRGWLADFDLASDFVAMPTARTLDPRTVGIELDKLLPAGRNVVYDAGNFLSILPYLSVPGPGHFKLAADFASIGMGFGTALGYACARPDLTTVLVVGDGGFLMTMSELETVAREDIPLVIVLMNDCAYGAELHYLKMRNMPSALAQFPDIDYAPVAQAFGIQSATVRTLAELRSLAPLLAKPQGPILIDVKINGAVIAPFMSEAVEYERRSV